MTDALTGAGTPDEPCGRISLRVSAVLTLILLLLCATFGRNMLYRDPQKLWEDVVRKSPGKTRGYNNLGTIYQGRDRFEDALRVFRRVIEIDPYAVHYGYGNIGNVYIDMKEYERAVEVFTRILAIQSRDYQSYAGRAKASFLLGRYRTALDDFDRAIAINPAVPRYYLYRGETHIKLNDLERGRQDMTRSCELGWQESCERLGDLEREGVFPH
jgi:tetratricopeptide (TPR) repeat protein